MQSKKRVYAGIGSRSTPGNVLAVMQQLGKSLAGQGWLLRSGNCSGADQAFQQGANAVDAGLVKLCLPWEGYEAEAVMAGNALCLSSSVAYALAERYHPAWQQCSAGARAMHARNAQIVLGAGLDEPVSYVRFSERSARKVPPTRWRRRRFWRAACLSRTKVKMGCCECVSS